MHEILRRRPRFEAIDRTLASARLSASRILPIYELNFKLQLLEHGEPGVVAER
jgi:hypothetical protein